MKLPVLIALCITGACVGVLAGYFILYFINFQNSVENADDAQQAALKPGVSENATKIWRRDLLKAVKEGNVSTTTSLIKDYSGDLKNLTEIRPFHAAISAGQAAVVKTLIENGLNIEELDQIKYTPLLRACLEGQEEIVKILLENGANVNITDNFNYTALSMAIISGNENIVQLLIEHGIDVQHPGGSAEFQDIFTAIQRGNEKIVRLMIENGVDIELKNKFEATPFNHAARPGKLSIAKMLYEKGANINAQNDLGYAALHWCVGDEEAVRWFVEIGADLTLMDKKGDTPRDHAQKIGYHKTVAILDAASEKKATN